MRSDEQVQADKEIGVRLRATRVQKGLSQSQLADKLGISFQQVQKYEAGTNRISGSRLVEYARVLQTTVSKLLGEDLNGDRHDSGELADLSQIKIAKRIAALPEQSRIGVLNVIESVERMHRADRQVRAA